MIERYTGKAAFTLNNDGQWVSYEQHRIRMRAMLEALKLAMTYKTSFAAIDYEVIENAFFLYCEEIPGMGEGEGDDET